MKTLFQLGEWIERGGFYLLLLLLPFSNAAIELTFWLLLCGWVAARTRQDHGWRALAPAGIGWAVVGYLAICALSIVVSDVPHVSSRALFSKWGQYLLFFVMVTDLAKRRPTIVRSALMVVACSSAFVALEAILQEVTGRGPFRGFPLSYYGRMTGPYKDPIDLATYLMVVVPLLMTYAMTVRRTGGRWALGLLLVALMGCFARTEALGAWIGLGAGLLAVSLFQATVRRVSLLCLVVVVCFGGFYLHRVGRLNEVFSLQDVGKVDRLAMWQAALGMIRDRPILGHGLNTFMGNYLKYWVGGERQPRYAHNCYLQVAAETGIIGLIAFLWLLGSVLWRVWEGLRVAITDQRLLLCGLLAGVFAFAVQAGVDTNFYSLRQAVLFWVMAGLALGLSESARQSASA